MIYPDTYEPKIGFDRIRELLAGNCLSNAGARRVEAMGVAFASAEVRRRLALTSEFQQVLSNAEPFPSDNYNDPYATLEKLRIEGTFPEVEEVVALRGSLDTIRKIIGFFKNRKDGRYPLLTELAGRVVYYPFVAETIDRIVDKEGKVRDSASPALKTIRAGLASKNLAAVRKLHSVLRQAQADGIVDRDVTVAVRNGRGVIPVSASNKRGIRGFVHDESATGKTVFIEPAEVVELNNEITELEHQEKREIVRILTALADTIRPYIDDLEENCSFLAEIDFIRAKALFGNRLGCIMPAVAETPHIRWINARHPLLTLSFARTAGREVVPLTITIDSRERILVISGPNAGGKSVCLKTVALVQYMLQCGMTIPVGEGTEAGIFSKFFIDIGDEQSLENDLSTYSSHLINMKHMLRHADDRSLVMIDEFGTGTEPVLGGALAEAILAELNHRGAYGVITTHYTNLKHFATSQEGISNGAMAFDNQLMQPLFRLDQGKPGSSFAFEIAKKIGLPQEILADAASRAGEGNVDFDRNLREIARDKRYWEKKREAVRRHEKRLEELIATYEAQIGDIKTQKKEIITQAKSKAEEMLRDTNRMIENTIRTIRETQAEKEKTREVREELDTFREHLEKEEKHAEIPMAPKPGKDTPAASIVKRITAKKEPTPPVKKKKRDLAPGDYVKIAGTDTVAQVTEIRGQKVQVVSGSLKMNVDISMTEPVSAEEQKKAASAGRTQQKVDWSLTARRNQFNPEIDVRGMRTEEALQVVQDFIDTALMIQYRNLRILHGKGNGILRQMIRQYLESTGAVRNATDEHVDRGGAGITLVELDI
ncbi:MAG: Smr/MutS family protein [Bacteroidales bacterium]|jgi:DNA mismatch repair protein MutS2|nr:Smr/MutS family protein [Bacteroidales bacterium]